MMGVLDLGNITVEDIMLPHNEILGVNLSDSSAVNQKIIQQSFYSNLPVYQETLDNLKGVLDLSNFLRKTDIKRKTKFQGVPEDIA